MLYTIKPEYLERWGDVATAGDIITENELERLSAEWDMEAEELRKQLDPVEDYVVNHWVDIIYYPAAEALMDKDLMDELNRELAPCSNQTFFDEYAKSHRERFGERWELDNPNPVY